MAMRHYPPRTPATGNTSWNGNRDRSTQARFRRHTLAAAGNQCQAITEDGRRCPITTGLQAHHTPTGGLTLCTPHHRAIDPHAR